MLLSAIRQTVSVLAVLSLMLLGSVSVTVPQAAAQVSDFHRLLEKIDRLERELRRQGGELEAARHQIDTLEELSRQGHELGVARYQIDTLEITHTTDIAALETNPVLALGPYVTVNTTDTINGVTAPHGIFTGINLHLRSGAGKTADPDTGLGNLIIGYNEETLSEPEDRSGAHNLVIGPSHIYSSYGGLVAGSGNAISGEYASVSGGLLNTASGPLGSVSGGSENRASGVYSSVSGGSNNTASGFQSSVSGGYSNTASADNGSVSGGGNNAANGPYTSVSGGYNRSATSPYSWRAGRLSQDH